MSNGGCKTGQYRGAKLDTMGVHFWTSTGVQKWSIGGAKLGIAMIFNCLS